MTLYTVDATITARGANYVRATEQSFDSIEQAILNHGLTVDFSVTPTMLYKRSLFGGMKVSGVRYDIHIGSYTERYTNVVRDLIADVANLR